MSYSPYYEGGWKVGSSGGTPITAAALNHMDDGIAAAATLSDVIVASGEKSFGEVAGGGTSSATISIGKTLANTNYLVITNSMTGNITVGIQSKTTSSFAMYIKNHNSSATTSTSSTIRWAIIKLP